MNLNQYAIYQLKEIPQNRKLRFHPYDAVMAQGASVRVENYDMVYLGSALPNDTPDSIYRRFCTHRPPKYKGRSLDISDVIVHNKNGVTTAYYIDQDDLIILAGFIRLNAEGAVITIETKGCTLHGQAGTWAATDEIVIDGQSFYLMENEKFGTQAAAVIVDALGKVIVDDCRNGFDLEMEKMLRKYLLSMPKEKQEAKEEHPEPPLSSASCEEQTETIGEASVTQETEEKQDIIILPPVVSNRLIDPRRRKSVLQLLRRKQAEIAMRGAIAAQSMQRETN